MTTMCAYPSCTADAEPGYDVCTGHASRTLLRMMLRDAQRERDEARAIADRLGVVLAKQQQYCVCGAVEAHHDEIWRELDAWADEREKR